jgi:hypothetical protein
MYCSGCGSPIATGLSFCNRCGTSLKERGESKLGSITALLLAITILGICGMGIALGGALVLREEAHLGEKMVAMFMFMTFFLVALIEVFLCRQLSRLVSTEKKQSRLAASDAAPPNELWANQPRSLSEPIPSVTENTTRTLEYSRRQQ